MSDPLREETDPKEEARAILVARKQRTIAALRDVRRILTERGGYGWTDALAVVDEALAAALSTTPAPDREALLAEFDGSVCPACHHRAHDPGGCSECPRCELHTDEAAAFVLRYEPELFAALSAPLAPAEPKKRERIDWSNVGRLTRETKPHE